MIINKPTYQASGLIRIQAGPVFLVGGPLAMTLPAPKETQNGETVAVAAGNAAAHVITFNARTPVNEDGTPGDPTAETATFDEDETASIVFQAVNGWWVVLGSRFVTLSEPTAVGRKSDEKPKKDAK